METTSSLLFLSSILLLLLHSSLAMHADHHSSAMDFLQKGNSSESISKLKTHLSNLGYLPKNHINDHFDDHLEKALKNYQSFFKLPSTGTLNSATLSHLRRPRCGVRDFVHNTSGHYVFFPGQPKWPAGKRLLTYSFPPGTRDDALQAMKDATDIWSAVTDYNLKFKYIGDYNAADIKISFQYRDHGDGSAFDGRGGTLAHASPTGGTLHFDGDEKWVNGVLRGAFDLQTVGLHEMGHILGLAHSPDNNAIMYPYTDIGSRKFLNTDDINGIKALYSI